jgi:hypothetical protein
LAILVAMVLIRLHGLVGCSTGNELVGQAGLVVAVLYLLKISAGSVMEIRE